MDGTLERQAIQDSGYGSAPEVVPGTAPEYISCGPYEFGHKIVIPGSESDSIENKDIVAPFSAITNTPWWRRKKVFYPAIIALVLVVGLSVGLGVGLSAKNRAATTSERDSTSGGENSGGGATDNSNGGNNITNSAPSCKGDLCGQVLSVVAHENLLHAFARTKDQRITILSNNGTSWGDGGDDLGAPPDSLIGQPTAGSWRVHDDFGRLDVYVVGDADRAVYRKYFSKAENWSGGQKIGQDVGSKLNFCTVGPAMMHLWTTTRSSGEIYHTFWVQKDDANISSDGLQGGITSEHGELFKEGRPWQRETEGGVSIGTAGSGIAAMCRAGAQFYHEVLWYDSGGQGLFFSQYNAKVGWAAPKQWKGDFLGDPTAVGFEADQDRWHFFGVQKSRELYYTSWESGDAVLRPLQNLGGSILSMPAVVSLRPGTIDVVAVDTDGRLQHKHFNGTGWASEWEDLKFKPHSAPTAVVSKRRLFVMFLTSNGSLVSLSRDATDVSEQWKGTFETESLGGSFASDYFMPES